MYSVVLMMAMSGGADVPAGFFGHGDCSGGCYGGCYGGDCYGGFGGSFWGGGHSCNGGSSCHGGHGWFRRGHSCHGGGDCYGSSCYGSSCYGSSCYGGYSCNGGGHSCHGGGGWFGHHRNNGCCGGGWGNCHGGCYGGGCYGGACYGGGCYGNGGCCGSGVSYGCNGCYGAPVAPAAPAAPAGEKIEKKPVEKTGELRTSAPVTLIVSLPANAKLLIDDAATTSTSSRRVFISPALPIGQEFTYSLKAEYTKNGKPVVVNKDVNVRAGAEINVTMEEGLASVASR